MTAWARRRRTRLCFLTVVPCVVLMLTVRHSTYLGGKFGTTDELNGGKLVNDFTSLTGGNVQTFLKHGQNDSGNVSPFSDLTEADVTTLQPSFVKINRNHSADTHHKEQRNEQPTGNLALRKSSFTSESKLAMLASNYDKPHLMTLYGSRGRLGNNLFQYAMLLSTARRYGYTPIVFPEFPLTKYLEIPEVQSVNLINKKKLGEKGAGIYNPNVANLDTNYNWTLDGFFQSWRYHDNPLVDSSIVFKPHILQSVKTFIAENRREGKKNICLHVRRGDFVTKNKTIGFDTAGPDYITKAMTYFRKNYSHQTLFIVLSDGMDWCKENVKGSDVIYSTFKDAGCDMALMSMCDHVIVTSGSFGWWGGRLCGGEVVYWKGFPRPGSPLAKLIPQGDLYPAHWVGLG